VLVGFAFADFVVVDLDRQRHESAQYQKLQLPLVPPIESGSHGEAVSSI
jgi:hypothetical protein